MTEKEAIHPFTVIQECACADIGAILKLQVNKVVYLINGAHVNMM